MVLVAAKIAVFTDGFPILAVTIHLFEEYAQRAIRMELQFDCHLAR
jgi:hypothetical protein